MDFNYNLFSTALIFLVTVQRMQLTHAASANTSRSYVDPKPIKYPGPVQQVANRYGTDETPDGDPVPDECKGKTFCTFKPPDYPEEQFNKMFMGYKSPPQPILLPDDEDLNRHENPNELDDCESTVTFEPLYKVRADRGVWRTVIQAPNVDFIQRVRLEECKETNSKCFLQFQDLGIETFCKQKFTTWEFLVWDEKNGSEKIKVNLPVCCSCYYRI